MWEWAGQVFPGEGERGGRGGGGAVAHVLYVDLQGLTKIARRGSLSDRESHPFRPPPLFGHCTIFVFIFLQVIKHYPIPKVFQFGDILVKTGSSICTDQ